MAGDTHSTGQTSCSFSISADPTSTEGPGSEQRRREGNRHLWGTWLLTLAYCFCVSLDKSLLSNLKTKWCLLFLYFQLPAKNLLHYVLLINACWMIKPENAHYGAVKNIQQAFINNILRVKWQSRCLFSFEKKKRYK